MFIGKYNGDYIDTFFAECDIEDVNIAIIDILAQLEDLSGETITIKEIQFYSAKPLKVSVETKITII